jgi:hypothetical protein
MLSINFYEEDEMAWGIVHRFPGGTKEQYEASIGAVAFDVHNLQP